MDRARVIPPVSRTPRAVPTASLAVIISSGEWLTLPFRKKTNDLAVAVTVNIIRGTERSL
jgi:hypothetical protein